MTPPKDPKERLSVNLPADLAQWVRDHARVHDTTISGVVAKAIRSMREAIRDSRRPK